MATSSSHSKSPPVRYRRLPGTGASLIQYFRLYQGPDHLLQVSTMWTQESYRRFYFQDIQAIIIRKTIHGTVWNGVWAVWAVFFSLLGLAAGGVTLWVLGILAGVGLVALVVNAAMGPPTATQIQTAVQLERLRSLNRLPRARRVLRQIIPLVQAAQRANETTASAEPTDDNQSSLEAR